MSKVQDRFSRFLSKLELTSAEFVGIKNKCEEVCETLHQNYYFLQYDETTRFLYGSYGKNTAISPPTDVDVLFILPPDEYYKYTDRSGNGQLDLLKDIKQFVSKKYYFTVLNQEDPSIMVNFITFNVRVKPAFFQADRNYLVPNIKDGGKWVIISPQSERQHLTESNNRSKGNTIRLIRMLKAWKEHRDVPIDSFTLELSAVEFLEEWKYYDEQLSYFDWMVRDYFTKLLTQLNNITDVPGISEKHNYGDRWEIAAKTALESAEKACELESEKNHVGATQEWVRIFGSRFPF